MGSGREARGEEEYRPAAGGVDLLQRQVQEWRRTKVGPGAPRPYEMRSGKRPCVGRANGDDCARYGLPLPLGTARPEEAETVCLDELQIGFERSRRREACGRGS